jgi:hypothetical protein
MKLTSLFQEGRKRKERSMKNMAKRDKGRKCWKDKLKKDRG